MNPAEMLWNYKPPPPTTKVHASEPMWTLTKGTRRLTCELKFHGEYGVETLVLRDGELYVGRRFPTRELALDEASIMHAQCVEHGWR
jgi:hypothetical protein